MPCAPSFPQVLQWPVRVQRLLLRRQLHRPKELRPQLLWVSLCVWAADIFVEIFVESFQDIPF